MLWNFSDSLASVRQQVFVFMPCRLSEAPRRIACRPLSLDPRLPIFHTALWKGLTLGKAVPSETMRWLQAKGGSLLTLRAQTQTASTHLNLTESSLHAFSFGVPEFWVVLSVFKDGHTEKHQGIELKLLFSFIVHNVQQRTGTRSLYALYYEWIYKWKFFKCVL